MLERARELTIAEHLDNVTYEHGDAQVHPFAPGHYDVAISRFGVMFFSDPVAAFGDIARAARGRAPVWLVWQSRERNEWAVAIDAALSGPARPRAPAKPHEAFSLGDRTATARVLERAGFHGIGFSDVREPVFHGRDTDAALAFVRGWQGTSAALAGMTDREAALTVERLRETLAAHYSEERGVVLGSRSWLITARRRLDRGIVLETRLSAYSAARMSAATRSGSRR